jgi:hypothetical protein
MGAPKGNSFWKSRSKHGRDKLFETPDLLLASAQDYFDLCDENPWKSVKSVTTNNGFSEEEKPIQRPYSLAGWRHYIGASKNWLNEFKKTCSKDFLGVIEEVEEFIANQQWEGATVGVFNANIIARTLGLTDKTDLTTKGESINNVPPITSEQIDKLIDKL